MMLIALPFVILFIVCGIILATYFNNLVGHVSSNEKELYSELSNGGKKDCGLTDWRYFACSDLSKASSKTRTLASKFKFYYTALFVILFAMIISILVGFGFGIE